MGKYFDFLNIWGIWTRPKNQRKNQYDLLCINFHSNSYVRGNPFILQDLFWYKSFYKIRVEFSYQVLYSFGLDLCLHHLSNLHFTWVIHRCNLKILAPVQHDLCKTCQSHIFSHSGPLSKLGMIYTMASLLLTFILNN